MSKALTAQAVLIDVIIGVLAFVFIPDIEDFKSSPAFLPSAIFVAVAIMSLCIIQSIYSAKNRRNQDKSYLIAYKFVQKFTAIALVFMAFYMFALAWNTSARQTNSSPDEFFNANYGSGVAIVTGDNNDVRTEVSSKE